MKQRQIKSQRQKSRTTYENKQTSILQLQPQQQTTLINPISPNHSPHGNLIFKSRKHQINPLEVTQFMALRRPTSNPNPNHSIQHDLANSKREMRKIQQTLKHFPCEQQPSQNGPRKKRKGNEEFSSVDPTTGKNEIPKEGAPKLEDAEILAETKQQSQFNVTPNRQPAETGKSPINDGQAKTQENSPPPSSSFLNVSFPLLQNFPSFFDFLIDYQYRQEILSSEQSERSFQHLESLGDTITVRKDSSEGTISRMRALIDKYQQILDRKPFSKAHRTLSANISKEAQEDTKEKK